MPKEEEKKDDRKRDAQQPRRMPLPMWNPHSTTIKNDLGPRKFLLSSFPESNLYMFLMRRLAISKNLIRAVIRCETSLVGRAFRNRVRATLSLRHASSRMHPGTVEANCSGEHSGPSACPYEGIK